MSGYHAIILAAGQSSLAGKACHLNTHAIPPKSELACYNLINSHMLGLHLPRTIIMPRMFHLNGCLRKSFLFMDSKKLNCVFLKIK